MGKIIDYLKANRRARAYEISSALSMKAEDVYLHLVKAESAGTVRVSVSYVGEKCECFWEIME